MTKIRIGLIGYGSMGKNHARVLSQLESIDFVGIVEPTFEKNKSQIGTPVYKDLDKLLDQKLDACIVATPTSSHLEVGKVLAHSKVATLIEKPLAQSDLAAEELVKAFDSNGVIGCVGHIERFNPAIQNLKLKLEDGLVGNVFQISTERHGPFPGRIGDVGVVSDLASHDIDLTRFVTNSEYDSINAVATYKSGRKFEDGVLAIGKLKNGVIFNHSVNWLTPFKSRQTLVLGENGALLASTLTGDLTYFENGNSLNDWSDLANFRGISEGNVTKFSFNKTEPLRNEIEVFINAVQTGDESKVVTFASGLKTVKVCSEITSRIKNT